MPRVYKRRVGARLYKNYSEETLQNALLEIKEKRISLRNAAEKYGIHRNTLWLKIHDKHPKKAGGQPVLSPEEEQLLVGHVIAMSTYGFPVTTFDLRCVVKSYLDRVGRNIPFFPKNFPGIEWAKFFLKRHPILTERIAKNITHARAATDEDIVNSFFDNIESELENIPASNIWNYDETNLVDDPGSSKIITKRGAKYPERIRNSSKACTSLMVCGNAAGELAPLYINYKSDKLWSTWTENGPPGARYNRTKSGWFDYQSFEDWFVSLMLPLLKKQDGKKVIIGDNLSSHINMEVIRLCEENNIKFIALAPNATHLLQPLDVAFFRPMKGAWRQILNDWKQQSRGSRCTSIPKDQFPTLLKELLNKLSEKTAQNLISGFRKTGIFPLNRYEVLNRLPNRVTQQDPVVQNTVTEAFLQHLESTRVSATSQTQRKRRKRLNVLPGKSIGTADIEPTDNPCSSNERNEIEENSVTFETGDNSDVDEVFTLQSKKKKLLEFQNESDNSSFSLHDSDSSMGAIDSSFDKENISGEDDDEGVTEGIEEETNKSNKTKQISTNKTELTVAKNKTEKATICTNQRADKTDKAVISDEISEGSYLLVEFCVTTSLKKFSKKCYVGLVNDVIRTDGKAQSYYCKFLRKHVSNKGKDLGGDVFIFPDVNDFSIVEPFQIIKILKLAKIQRGRYYFENVPDGTY